MAKDIPLNEGLPPMAGGVDPRSINAVTHGLTVRRVLNSEAGAYHATFLQLQTQLEEQQMDVVRDSIVGCMSYLNRENWP